MGGGRGGIVIGYDDNGYPEDEKLSSAKTKKRVRREAAKSSRRQLRRAEAAKKCGLRCPSGTGWTYWYENALQAEDPHLRRSETYESRIRLHIMPEIGRHPAEQADAERPAAVLRVGSRKSGRKTRSPTSTAKGCPTEWCVCVTPPAAPHWRRRCRMG